MLGWLKNYQFKQEKWTQKNIAAKYPDLADIAIHTHTSSQISIFIGADQPHLHSYTDIRKRNPN